MFPTGIMGVIGLVSMFLGVMSFRESPTLMKKIIAVIVFRCLLQYALSPKYLHGGGCYEERSTDCWKEGECYGYGSTV